MLTKNRSLALTSLLLLISITTIAINNTDSRQYDIKINHAAKTLQVELCFKNAPRYLYANSGQIEQITNQIYWKNESGYHKKKIDNGNIYLPSTKSGCLSYQVSINNEVSKRRKRSSVQHPNDIIIHIDSWLWYASDRKKRIDTTINFQHKKNINVSTPWRLVSRKLYQTRFKLKYTPGSWAGYIAIGKFHIEDIKSNHQRFRVALINGTNDYDKQTTLQWVKKMTASVAAIGGDFPVNDIQILVIFNSGSNGAVPWGQVNRGGGSGVLFIVNPDRSKKELMDDWTAAHEFSHLLLPFTPSDRWFSEGFASYYQNISRARTGILDEKIAWKKLIEGFERGVKSVTNSNAPILGSNKSLKLMQTYWGGAVIALKADIALQEVTSGKFNLSRALRLLSSCCLETGREWTAKKTFNQLDKLTDTQVFSNLYHNEVMKYKFPEYQSLLRDLGIHKKYSGEIQLDDNAPKAHIRKKIING